MRVVKVVLAGALLVAAAATPGRATNSIVYGIDIPFPIVDTVTPCAATGAVTMYPQVVYGPVDTELYYAGEYFTAKVTSPVCPQPWTVTVTIVDASPTYETRTATNTAVNQASVLQVIQYGDINRATPVPTRGPSEVQMTVAYSAPNGVHGCLIDVWEVVPFAIPVEVGPIVPCVPASQLN